MGNAGEDCGVCRDTQFPQGLMCEEHYKHIFHHIHTDQDCSFLVFGLGSDSELWANATQGKVLFVEDNAEYLQQPSSNINAVRIPFNSKVGVWCKEPELPRAIHRKWDYAFVDGPVGASGCPGRQFPIAWASQCVSKKVFVHDYERSWERSVCDRWLGKPAYVLDMPGVSDRKLAVFDRTSARSRRSCLRSFELSPNLLLPEALIIVAGRNCENCIDNCFQSLQDQVGIRWRCVFVDDASDDRTFEKASEYASRDGRFIVSRNPCREWAAKSRWNALQIATKLPDIHPSDVVLLLDGDDWLHNSESLFQIVDFQSRYRLLASHGNYCDENGVPCDWSSDYPEHVRAASGYRRHLFVGTHARAFRWGLVKYLDDRVFLNGGENIRAATDFALYIPVLELAGRHTLFNHQISYVYNTRAGEILDQAIKDERLYWRQRIEKLPPVPALQEDELNNILQTRDAESADLSVQSNRCSRTCSNAGCSTNRLKVADENQNRVERNQDSRGYPTQNNDNVHFVWLGGDLPAEHAAEMDRFKALNPNLRIRLWQDVPESMPDDLREVFENAAPLFCQKSDIIRVWVLLELGGMYFDTDVAWINSIEHLRNKLGLWATGTHMDVSGFAMGALPANPLLETYRRRIVEKARQRAYVHRQCYGPDCLAELVNLGMDVLPRPCFDAVSSHSRRLAVWNARPADRPSMIERWKDCENIHHFKVLGLHAGLDSRRSSDDANATH